MGVDRADRARPAVPGLQPGRQRPDRPLGPRRAPVRRRRPRDARRGDWIFPTFNGEPRYHKPILIYWLMGLTTAVGGRQPVRRAAGLGDWPARRRCSASGGWAAGCSGRAAGRWPALIFATAPIVVAESKLATTDATLALWLLGCQACLWVLGAATVPGGRGAVLGLPQPGHPDQGPDRAGLDRGLGRCSPGGGAGPSRLENGSTGDGDWSACWS